MGLDLCSSLHADYFPKFHKSPSSYSSHYCLIDDNKKLSKLLKVAPPEMTQMSGFKAAIH